MYGALLVWQPGVDGHTARCGYMPDEVRTDSQPGVSGFTGRFGRKSSVPSWLFPVLLSFFLFSLLRIQPLYFNMYIRFRHYSLCLFYIYKLFWRLCSGFQRGMMCALVIIFWTNKADGKLLGNSTRQKVKWVLRTWSYRNGVSRLLAFFDQDLRIELSNKGGPLRWRK